MSILRKNPIEQCFCKTNVLAAKLVHLKNCAWSPYFGLRISQTLSLSSLRLRIYLRLSLPPREWDLSEAFSLSGTEIHLKTFSLSGLGINLKLGPGGTQASSVQLSALPTTDNAKLLNDCGPSLYLRAAWEALQLSTIVARRKIQLQPLEGNAVHWRIVHCNLLHFATPLAGNRMHHRPKGNDCLALEDCQVIARRLTSFQIALSPVLSYLFAQTL